MDRVFHPELSSRELEQVKFLLLGTRNGNLPVMLIKCGVLLPEPSTQSANVPLLLASKD